MKSFLLAAVLLIPLYAVAEDSVDDGGARHIKPKASALRKPQFSHDVQQQPASTSAAFAPADQGGKGGDRGAAHASQRGLERRFGQRGKQMRDEHSRRKNAVDAAAPDATGGGDQTTAGGGSDPASGSGSATGTGGAAGANVRATDSGPGGGGGARGAPRLNADGTAAAGGDDSGSSGGATASSDRGADHANQTALNNRDGQQGDRMRDEHSQSGGGNVDGGLHPSDPPGGKPSGKPGNSGGGGHH